MPSTVAVTVLRINVYEISNKLNPCFNNSYMSSVWSNMCKTEIIKGLEKPGLIEMRFSKELVFKGGYIDHVSMN